MPARSLAQPVAALPLLAGLVAASSASAQPVRYKVIDLGTVPGASTICPCFFPQAIAEDGSVAGFYFGADGDYNAFLARPGEAMIDLGSLGGSIAFGRALNSRGEVVGFSTDASDGQAGFRWRDGVIDPVGLDASGINDAGQIVGDFRDRRGFQRPYLWTDGDLVDLGTHGGEFGDALDVNEAGHAVGWAWNEARDRLPTLWRDGAIISLGTLGGDIAAATAVNDADQVVGGSSLDPLDGSTSHAFLWTEPSGIVDLGLLPEAGAIIGTLGPLLTSTRATDINNAGWIVGNSFPNPWAGDPGRPGPWMWEAGAMVNINDLLADGDGWVIFEANGINNAGQIAAVARRGGGDSRAVRLDPICAADCDASGALDVFDFLCFQNQFGAGSALADCDGSGGLDFFDFLCFQTAFGAGCD